MTKGQAEHLMPMLQGLLAAQGLGWSDLTALAVGTGPGNFTGIRIAVSAARGLALGLSIPAVGVSGFEALAHGLPRPVAARIAAPRGQAYMQVLRAAADDAPSLTGASIAPPAGIPLAPEASPQTLVGNIARIGLSRLGGPVPRPAPLYVRGADAAPPRDPAPVIVP